jgi:hypothetical protein
MRRTRRCPASSNSLIRWLDIDLPEYGFGSGVLHVMAAGPSTKALNGSENAFGTPCYTWPKLDCRSRSCLKLFFYDLRQLETLYRILSFIVLGLMPVSVFWVYTRFRDRVQRYL